MWRPGTRAPATAIDYLSPAPSSPSFPELGAAAPRHPPKAQARGPASSPHAHPPNGSWGPCVPSLLSRPRGNQSQDRDSGWAPGRVFSLWPLDSSTPVVVHSAQMPSAQSPYTDSLHPGPCVSPLQPLGHKGPPYTEGSKRRRRGADTPGWRVAGEISKELLSEVVLGAASRGDPRTCPPAS